MDACSRSTVAMASLALAAALWLPLAADARPHFVSMDSIHFDFQGVGSTGFEPGPYVVIFRHQPPPEAQVLLMRWQSGNPRSTAEGRFEDCDPPPAGSRGWSWGRRSVVKVVKKSGGDRELEIFAEASRSCRIRLPLPASSDTGQAQAVGADETPAVDSDRKRSAKPKEIVVVGSRIEPPARQSASAGTG